MSPDRGLDLIRQEPENETETRQLAKLAITQNRGTGKGQLRGGKRKGETRKMERVAGKAGGAHQRHIA
jgi:hypothetical protein